MKLQKEMRTLDIEFEGQQHPHPPLNNGFRPHGGYRGTNRYPISQYTFNKSADDRRKLKDDLDRLFGSDSFDSLPSPFYAIDASRESNHSGESPLFEHKLLAPSRLEQKLSTEEYVREYLPTKKKSGRPSSGVQYYRPESPHQYLPASSRQDDPNSKYGRPTRTTLLRARNRCNSAPVNIYKMRKEVQKQYEQKMESSRPKTASVTVRDLLNSTVSEGESIHSFLIGARYNRAHCLDSKSVQDHGVYMPRGNPLGCFITRDKLREEDEEDTPATPPDSLMSNSDNEEEPAHSDNRQAWTSGQTERKKITKHDITLQHYINTDDGLNVKGNGVTDPKQKSRKPLTRPNSSRVQNYSRSARAQSARVSGNNSKPFVVIQGKSLPRGTKSLEQAGLDNGITHKSSKQVRDQHSATSRASSARGQRVKSARQHTRTGSNGGNGNYGNENTRDWEKENGVASPVSSVHFRPRSGRNLSASGIRAPQQASIEVPDMNDINTPVQNEVETTYNLKKTGSELDEDKISTSVENGAPSEIKGDTMTTTDIAASETETGREEGSLNQGEGHQPKMDSDLKSPEKLDTTSKDNQLEAKRTSRVRFADEIQEFEESGEDKTTSKEAESQVGQGDNAVFFITEDRDGEKMRGSGEKSAVGSALSENNAQQQLNNAGSAEGSALSDNNAHQKLDNTGSAEGSAFSENNTHQHLNNAESLEETTQDVQGISASQSGAESTEGSALSDNNAQQQQNTSINEETTQDVLESVEIKSPTLERVSSPLRDNSEFKDTLQGGLESAETLQESGENPQLNAESQEPDFGEVKRGDTEREGFQTTGEENEVITTDLAYSEDEFEEDSDTVAQN